MTKAQLIELIQRDLCGGTPSPEQLDMYNEFVISHKIALVWADFLSIFTGKNISSLDNFVKVYDGDGEGVRISRNIIQDNYYSMLPEVVLNIPNLPTAGLRFIEGLQNREILFTPITRTQGMINRNLEVYKYDKTIPFLVKPKIPIIKSTAYSVD